jgi:V/A-type H+/Na+-transporting ATPase subunit I
MFYPQAMTEIELIVPAGDILSVTKLLSGQGIFHQTDGSYLNTASEAGAPNSWQEKASAYSALERRIQAIMQSLGVEENLSGLPPFENLADLDTVRPTVDQIELEVKQTSDQMANEHKSLEQLENTLQQLEPVAGIDLDISSLRNHRYLFSMLGTMPLDHVERLQTSLARIPFVFMTLRQDAKKAVVWLAGAQNNADVLKRAARSAYLNAFVLPETYQGTPSEIIALVHKNMDAAKARIVELKGSMVGLSKNWEKQLQALLWNVRASRMQADAIVRYGKLQYTYVVVGWVVTAGLEELTQRIKQASKETLIETYATQRAGAQNVPVSLKHNKLLAPFQMLVTTYGRPQYSEIDPTLIVAVMFPFLFGVMFGDVGQGLVLIGLGWLLTSKKVKAMRGLAGLGGLITACGAVATVFGFLYGSIFGFEEVIHALWMEPVKNILTILGIAIGGGVVLLSIAFMLGIYNAYRAKDWGHFFFDPHGLAGLILYWSLICMGLSMAMPAVMPVPSIIFIVLASVSGLCVMFSEVLKHLIEGHRPLVEGGVVTYFIQAFFEIFETVISLLSNSLSYVRVGAFAVAHGGLSAAIFILAGLSGQGTIGYWITVIIGNVFIVGLEGLIVGIQTMRLSYYEFFGKFFTGGGMRYEPLSLRPAGED